MRLRSKEQKNIPSLKSDQLHTFLPCESGRKRERERESGRKREGERVGERERESGGERR